MRDLLEKKVTFLELATLVIVTAAAIAGINATFVKLPTAVGILAISLATSIAVLAIDAIVPGLELSAGAAEMVSSLAFDATLLEGMLGLLLFAGALHVRVEELKKQLPVVLLMASLGVAISTAFIGTAFSIVTGMPLLIALVFGAIITPTDPVAVMGVLKTAGIGKSLETKIAGESLFNDGVAYVVFLLLIALAFTAGGAHGDADAHGFSAAGAATLFVQEAIGGAVLGAFLGWVTFRIMRKIDDYAVEVLLTLALVMGGYMLALKLHLSAPIMAVMAGLFIGHVGMKGGMSEETRTHVDAFWRIIDEILNMVLFLMIGIEVFAIDFSGAVFVAGLLGIMLSLSGRFLAVFVPMTLLRRVAVFSPGALPMLTWGGIKGGISIALALSLPDGPNKDLILGATYVVVIFSILVQGLTIAPLARRLARRSATASPTK